MNKAIKLSYDIDEMLETDVSSPYSNLTPISEDLHPLMSSVLDSDAPTSSKFSKLSKVLKDKTKKGEDTGLSEAAPKKGSARAVFFPKATHKYELDGKPTESHSVVKVAYHGTLDKYNKSGKLLGEHQNEAENSPFTNREFGVISEKTPGKYVTNHEAGVLAPHFGSHESEDSYVHQGRVDKFNAKDFKSATKTKEFPKGISHSEFFGALMQHHADAMGTINRHHGGHSYEHLEKVQQHPLVEKFQDFVSHTDTHPGDFNPRNLGVWTHPHTGQKHIVAADYGFTHDVAKEYNNARKNMMNSKLGARRY